jgi:hypothetical protein
MVQQISDGWMSKRIIYGQADRRIIWSKRRTFAAAFVADGLSQSPDCRTAGTTIECEAGLASLVLPG